MPAAAFPDSTTAPLRVLIVDDNFVVRAGLSALLGGRADIEVAGEAADGREALALARTRRPDVVLLDVRMPGVDGIAALPHLAAIAPVVMLTYSREDDVVREALRRGAGGYLVHGEFTADGLVTAVHDVRHGRAHLTTSAATALVHHVRSRPPEPARPPLPDGLGNVPGPLPGIPTQTPSHTQPRMALSSEQTRNHVGFGLSSREVEVMDLIASGMSNQQIADTCFISQKTVKNHINRIFAKLHSATRSEAIALWLGTSRRPAQGVAGHA
ncbi:response regulator transcription factor [Streptomyces bambusae]|uniref:response regulator transcription factor n=1 Tax=Streptomyces bambusae TaxID=1550616 RepID=UPI001D0003AC|nr:response regulator transcription factor [Streptomyces bambusae]MCB5170073.1 response regulator transcription factor [Streptomyces bambusae]